jgi:hypothetical protein
VVVVEGTFVEGLADSTGAFEATGDEVGVPVIGAGVSHAQGMMMEYWQSLPTISPSLSNSLGSFPLQSSGKVASSNVALKVKS